MKKKGSTQREMKCENLAQEECVLTRHKLRLESILHTNSIRYVLQTDHHNMLFFWEF